MGATAIQTRMDVRRDEVARVLCDRLGPMFRVSVHFHTIYVSRTGEISSAVRVARHDGMTTMTIRSTGITPSRLLHTSSINPQVRAVLKQRYESEEDEPS